MTQDPNNPEVEMIVSGDGSHTLRLIGSNEHYGSTHGALEESDFIFIQNGLDGFKESRSVNVLEVGFGTGANAILSFLWAKRHGVELNYTALEPYPLDERTWKALNYPDLLRSKSKEPFCHMHECAWGVPTSISDQFTLLKLKRSVLDLSEDSAFDLVYFDAFGPDTQSELWTLPVLQKVYKACSPGAVFVTYCAKGQVRRDLGNSGFEVQRRPGPPAKRHILWAKKP